MKEKASNLFTVIAIRNGEGNRWIKGGVCGNFREKGMGRRGEIDEDFQSDKVGKEGRYLARRGLRRIHLGCWTDVQVVCGTCRMA